MVQLPRRGGWCGCEARRVREPGSRDYGAAHLEGLVFQAVCSATHTIRVRRSRVLCSAVPQQLTTPFSLALFRQLIIPLPVAMDPLTEPSLPVAPLRPLAIPLTPVQTSTSDPPACEAITPALPVPPSVPPSGSSPGAAHSGPQPTGVRTVT